MKLTIHQAVYGEYNNGHTLLSNTHLDQAFLDELKLLTDLPDNQPPGIIWEPFISGFSLESYYVFLKTFPDLHASRSGMVLTHALILDLEKVIKISDISSILQLLPLRLEKPKDVQVLIIDVPESTDLLFQSGDTIASFSKLVHLLLKNSSGSQPVVWIGQNFESVVSSLWYSFWPEARKQIAFRLSFGPNDIGTRKLTVVTTLEGLEHKWRYYPIVRREENHTPSSLAEAFLLGLPKGQPLHKFQDDLEVTLASLDDLKKLEQTYNYVTSLHELKPDAIRSLVRFVALLSPNPQRGIKVKKNILDRVVQVTKTGDAAHIRGLRNLNLDFYKDGNSIIGNSITSWIVSNANGVHSNEVASIISEALSTPGTQWSIAVQDGTQQVLASWNSGTALCIWTWWQNEQTLVINLEKYIPRSRDVEEHLATLCPTTLLNELGSLICSFSKKREWFQLHAAVAGAYLTPSKAFEKQLQFDRDTQYLEGLRLLSTRVQPSDIVEAALAYDDERLLQMAGEACVSKPALLAQLDVENQRWRAIWHRSIQISHNPWHGIPDPKEIIDNLMQLLMQGQHLEDDLLLKLAHTNYSDLTENPKRHELWNIMTPDVRQAFLIVTAKGWIERFRINTEFDRLPELPLRNEILKSKYGLLKTNLPNAIPIGIATFQKFQSLSEKEFKDWLRNVLTTKKNIEPVDANLLGSVIVKKIGQKLQMNYTMFIIRVGLSAMISYPR